MSASSPHPERHFVNTLPTAPLDAAERDVVAQALLGGLEELRAYVRAGEGLRGPGCYVGLSGVALALLAVHRLARLPAAPLGLDAGAVLAEALDVSGQAVRLLRARPQPGRVTFLEGASGVLAVHAALCSAAGRKQEAQAAAQAVRDMHAAGVAALPPGECEVLYGRAGYLYCLLWLGRHLGPAALDRAAVKELVAHLLAQGRREARAGGGRWELMYRWHDSQYLGAIHGVAGVLLVVLQAAEQLAEPGWPAAEDVASVRAAALQLVGCCHPSGNLPSSVGSASDKLVHVCHGAPGLLLLLAQCARQLPDDAGAWQQAAHSAAEVVWTRGLLRKGVGLCHGISGNALALLAAHRATGDADLAARAQRLALFAAQHWGELLEVPDHPASLYEGLAGAVALWADVLRDPEGARFPGMELDP